MPHAIRDKVKAELDSMVRLGVIRPITEPTAIVSPIVIVLKNDKLKLCIDPSDLNKHILRRHFPLRTVEERASRVRGSNFFTLLDCRRGFWQIKIAEDS